MAPLRILAIDTAADYCAVILFQDCKLIAQRIIDTQRDQARILAPLTRDVLIAAAWDLSMIDRLAIGTGPGSFTGLRVGFSFIRGLALAIKKPIIGFDHFVTTWHAVHSLLSSPVPVLIIRASKRADLFYCLVGIDGKLGEYSLADGQALAAMLDDDPNMRMAGDGASQVIDTAPHLKKRLIEIDMYAPAFSLGVLAANALQSPASPPTPLYLRDADVSFPKQHP
jgi:tRNA threonylcarbamoyladenosine biosynthesis protein TsaB